MNSPTSSEVAACSVAVMTAADGVSPNARTTGRASCLAGSGNGLIRCCKSGRRRPRRLLQAPRRREPFFYVFQQANDQIQRDRLAVVLQAWVIRWVKLNDQSSAAARKRYETRAERSLAVCWSEWLGGGREQTGTRPAKPAPPAARRNAHRMERVPAPAQLPPVGGQGLRLPTGHLVVDGHGQEHGVNDHGGEEAPPPPPPTRGPACLRGPGKEGHPRRSGAESARTRRASRGTRAAARGLGGADVGGVVQGGDARVEENGDGQLVADHRAGDHDGRKLKETRWKRAWWGVGKERSVAA